MSNLTGVVKHASTMLLFLAAIGGLAACYDADSPLLGPLPIETSTGTGMGGHEEEGGAGGGSAGSGAGGMAAGGSGGESFELTSPAFVEGHPIPPEYQCDVYNVSPELAWSGAPDDAESFAVVLRDLDYDNGFLHWVIYDIRGDLDGVPLAVENAYEPPHPVGSRQAESFYAPYMGYIGPCSPDTVNTYEFTVHALDVATLPNLDMQSTMAEAVVEIEAHAIASAALSGES